MAGVTIAALTGSDSAPTKANEAKQKNDIGAARDQVYLFASNAQTEAYEEYYVKSGTTTAGNASKNVSDFVKDKIKTEYASNKNKKVGLASIVSSADGSTITISTTDFEETGTISATGGTLSWSGIVGKTVQEATPQTSNTKKMNEVTFSDIQLEVGNTHTITLPANTEDIVSCSCSDSAISVTNAGVITANGATSGAVVTITGVSGQSTTVTVIVTSSQEPLSIGSTVNYSTSLNEVDLDDWRVFYIDGDDTYLILDGFLPNSAVNVDNICSEYEWSDYCVDAGSEEVSRGDFIREMTTTTNWSELVTNGKINGESINQNVLNDMWAMGSPTLQLYVNSWNESYPNAQIYMDSVECEDGCDGYFISLTEEALEREYDYIQPDSYDDEIEVDEETGEEVIVGGPRISYYNAVEDDHQSRKLYDPYYYEGKPESVIDGYWLATGSWDGGNSYADVYTAGGGYVSSAWASDNYYYNGEYALRPVIKLPTSILNQ